MSGYTAYIAVDATWRTAGKSGVTVMQRVPVPAGARYESTVIDRTDNTSANRVRKWRCVVKAIENRRT